MNARDVLFYVYATVSLLSATGIIWASRVVHAVMWLFVTMVALAGVYLTLGSELIAAVQLFVYGGAITVLALFALVLTRPSRELSFRLTSAPQWIAAVSSLALFGGLATAVLDTPAGRAGVSADPGTAAVASELFGRHVVLFEVAGLLLTVALIGAIVVARKDGAS